MKVCFLQQDELKKQQNNEALRRQFAEKSNQVIYFFKSSDLFDDLKLKISKMKKIQCRGSVSF